MIYLKHFELLTRQKEEAFFFGFKRTCFESGYPFGVFSGNKDFHHIDFNDITILSGGNGSGKSTLLNIIAETLRVQRGTAFNKTYFFEPYCSLCNYQLSSSDEQLLWVGRSKIITSDDVFDHIIEVRHENNDIFAKRQTAFGEHELMVGFGGNSRGDRPREIHLDDNESVKEFAEYADQTKMSASAFVRKHIGLEERTYSNGENGFRFFLKAIQSGGLYLLDEPENSLSAEMQMELVHFLHGMARCHSCQFIISSHSPFILSVPGARIYNLDDNPVTTCRWVDLPNVRAYHDFFKNHEADFDTE